MRTRSLDSRRTGPLDGGGHIWSVSKIFAGFSHQTDNKNKVCSLLLTLVVHDYL